MVLLRALFVGRAMASIVHGRQGLSNVRQGACEFFFSDDTRLANYCWSLSFFSFLPAEQVHELLRLR